MSTAVASCFCPFAVEPVAAASFSSAGRRSSSAVAVWSDRLEMKSSDALTCLSVAPVVRFRTCARCSCASASAGARLRELQDHSACGGERDAGRHRRLLQRARGFLAGRRLLAERLVDLRDAAHGARRLGADLDNDVRDTRQLEDLRVGQDAGDGAAVDLERATRARSRRRSARSSSCRRSARRSYARPPRTPTRARRPVCGDARRAASRRPARPAAGRS